MPDNHNRNTPPSSETTVEPPDGPTGDQDIIPSPPRLATDSIDTNDGKSAATTVGDTGTGRPEESLPAIAFDQPSEITARGVPGLYAPPSPQPAAEPNDVKNMNDEPASPDTATAQSVSSMDARIDGNLDDSAREPLVQAVAYMPAAFDNMPQLTAVSVYDETFKGVSESYSPLDTPPLDSTMTKAFIEPDKAGIPPRKAPTNTATTTSMDGSISLADMVAPSDRSASAASETTASPAIPTSLPITDAESSSAENKAAAERNSDEAAALKTHDAVTKAEAAAAKAEEGAKRAEDEAGKAKEAAEKAQGEVTRAQKARAVAEERAKKVEEEAKKAKEAAEKAEAEAVRAEKAEAAAIKAEARARKAAGDALKAKEAAEQARQARLNKKPKKLASQGKNVEEFPLLQVRRQSVCLTQGAILQGARKAFGEEVGKGECRDMIIRIKGRLWKPQQPAIHPRDERATVPQ
jgi:hypothetical protein